MTLKETLSSRTLIFLIAILTGCAPHHDRVAEAEISQLRSQFPINLGLSAESLPKTSQFFPAAGYALSKMSPITGEKEPYLTYLVQGPQNGVCRVYLHDGRVSRVDFAFGTKESGIATKFIRLF